MEDRKLVGEIFKNSLEVIRVYSYCWKGQDLIDARVWYVKDPTDSENAVATKKGLCIRPDSLPELISILQKLDRKFNKKQEPSA